MAKIKHIAIATQDAAKTAKFYVEVFGLKQIAELDGENAKGFYLSDGNINVAVLDFQNDQVAGAERGKDYSGIHHIGFEVESLEEVSKKMEAADAKPRDDINQALHIGMGGLEMDGPHAGNVEFKYSGPDGVIIDVSETGWVGTRGLD